VEAAYGDKNVGAEKVKLVNGEMDHWEKLWLENRAAYIHENGWEMKQRDILEDDFLSYMSEMEENKLLIRDEFIDDYLRQLILMIHPGKLIRPHEKQIDIVVLSSSEPEIFAFNCGTIVITTSKISSMENEEEMVKLLSQYVAHLVLEDNLNNLTEDIQAHQAADLFTTSATIASAVAMGISNIRRGTNFGPGDVWLVNRASSFLSHSLISSVGANYPSPQVSIARHNAAIMVNNLKEQEGEFRNENNVTSWIAPVLRNDAWQSYYLNDYELSGKTLDRLFGVGIENEEDYLLLAKLYRAKAEDDAGLQLALDAITKAEELDDFNFVEVLFEKGKIMIRMEKYQEAKVEFEEFLSVTEEVGGDQDEIEEAKRMVIHCDELLGER